MLHFECDYTRGAHPAVLQRLTDTNAEATPGYGDDAYCERARALIREACGTPEAAVWFFVGGTQTNATVIAGLLRPWQGVVTAHTGHINGHEAGAVELSGHKVIAIPGEEGKLTAASLRAYLAGFYADEAWTHIAEPGMVYLSFPTEYGTVYSQAELTAIHEVCRDYGIPLYIDGARLGYGLTAEGGDVTLRSLAASCEAFYIGGTKVGALFGEAAVFPDPSLCPRFFTVMKQHGAVLAKGRLLGLQFEALFTDGLYETISRNAVTMAARLKAGLRERGCRFHIDSPTNQVFVVLSREEMAALDGRAVYSVWEPYDEDHAVVRFCTDWATSPAEVDALLALL